MEEAAGLRAHGLPIPANDSEPAAAAWKYWEQPSDGSEFACGYNISGAAVVPAAGDASSRQPSARSCAEACRCCHCAHQDLLSSPPTPARPLGGTPCVKLSKGCQGIGLSTSGSCWCSAHPGCTAWVWCKDAQRRPCFDAQSGTWVQHHGCALLQLPVLPMAPPDPGELNSTSGTDRLRSFAAGYTKSANRYYLGV